MDDCAEESHSETSSPSSLTQKPQLLQEPIDTALHSCKFKFMANNTGGRKLVSDRFVAGGYEWAIDFYPSGTRIEDDPYISLFITLESIVSDVNARFELILVDQSSNGKHMIRPYIRMHTPCLMTQGSQWGFRQFIEKTKLQKSYLKDGYLIVNCRIEVCKESESNISCSPLAVDRVQDLELSYSPLLVDQVEESEDYHLKDTISDYETKGVDLIQMTTEKLLAELRNISDWSRNTVEADTLSSTDSSSLIATSCSQELPEGDHIALSSDEIYHLRCIAERLNITGQLQECLEVYNISRKSVFHASPLRLGMGNWGLNDISCSDTTEFARKIKVWIRASQMYFLIYFPREKQNFETIFDGFKDVTYDTCFVVLIVKDAAIQLCNFAETISESYVSVGKLFAVLDLYKSLLLYLPHIKSTFHSASTESICAQAERTLDRLVKLIRKIVSSFEESVLHEQLNMPTSRGTLHSITRYIINYVAEIVHYKELLTEIIISEPTTSLVATNEIQFLEVGGRKPLALHLLWIIMSLKFNLEVKSKVYNDINLAHLFLMNNLHYIVERIKESYELAEMIGEDYVTKLSKDVLEEARNYLGSWDKVLYCFRAEGLYYKVFAKWIPKNILKERFKSFHATFEEVLQTQSTWFVPDLQLRIKLRQMILSKFIPAYKSFMEKFSRHMENEKNKERYIKYSTEELENKIRNMFIE